VRKLSAVALFAVALAAGGPTIARADDSDAPQALFDRGLAHYDAHEYSAAAESWEALLATSGEEKAWSVRYNLGLAYEAMGDDVRAVISYDAFVRRVGELPGVVPSGIEERRQDAVDRSARLKQGLGAIHVTTHSTESFTVRVDGGDATHLPLSTFVSPGGHSLDAGEGGRARHVSFEVAAGASIDLDVAPLDPPAPPPKPPAYVPFKPPSPPTHVEAEHFPTALVLVGVGATALSFFVPMGFGIAASDKRAEAEDLGRGNSRYESAVADFESARTIYYATYVVPAVLGAATIAVTIVGAARAGHEKVVVGVGPRAGGASMHLGAEF
jgi:hypothetical protein